MISPRNNTNEGMSTTGKVQRLRDGETGYKLQDSRMKELNFEKEGMYHRTRHEETVPGFQIISAFRDLWTKRALPFEMSFPKIEISS